MNAADVLVLGGGASGLVSAITAAEQGDRVCVLEAQNRLGRKILASGNGRCNLMNLNEPVYYGETGFAAEVLRACPPERIREFWHRHGLLLRDNGGGLMYPCTFKSSSVMEILLQAVQKERTDIRLGQRAIRILQDAEGFKVTTLTGESFFAGRLILATGGPAQPRLGGRGDAPLLLQPFGHTSVPYEPSLTPLVTDAVSVSGLAGIRVRCRIAVESNGKEVHSETGELLFTEEGISGICAMQCARFASPGTVCRLNLVYDLWRDRRDLTAELMRRKKRFAGEEPVSLLMGICVPKLAFAVCKQAGLALRGEKNADLEEAQIRRIAASLTGYTLQILDRKGFEEAQVSSGGLRCSEFEAETMASRFVKGLHAAGEALNVDGDCGGFNLMFAWASGILAGKNGR